MADTKPRARSRTAGSNGARSNGSDQPAGSQEATGKAGGASAGMEVLLTDASLGPVRRWLPGRAMAKAGAKLATRPDKAARRAVGLGGELAKIAIGRSEVAPAKGD